MTSGSVTSAVRVYLIGLMGSGKSTIGSLLADTLGTDYVDNDAGVSALAGVDVVELSHRGGEELHEWEHRYVEHLVTQTEPTVAGIAASTADRPEDLRALREHGVLVYLHCPVDVLAQRIRQGPPRPWIDGDPQDLIAQMYRRRDPVLRDACELTVDSSGRAEDAVAAIRAGLPG